MSQDNCEEVVRVSVDSRDKGSLLTLWVNHDSWQDFCIPLQGMRTKVRRTQKWMMVRQKSNRESKLYTFVYVSFDLWSKVQQINYILLLHQRNKYRDMKCRQTPFLLNRENWPYIDTKNSAKDLISKCEPHLRQLPFENTSISRKVSKSQGLTTEPKRMLFLQNISIITKILRRKKKNI